MTHWRRACPRSIAVILCALGTGCGLLTTEQTDPIHAGHWRTTVSSGQVYLADDLVYTYTRTEQSARAAWIPASAQFGRRAETP